jgi:hypothetical protein
MQKVLKNYKQRGGKLEEYPLIKILDYEDVFADLPLCVAEFGVVYVNPVLVDNQVMEYDYVAKKLAELKMFHLFKDDSGSLREVPEGEANLHIRLPKETDLSELHYENGRVVKLAKEVTNNGD